MPKIADPAQRQIDLERFSSNLQAVAGMHQALQRVVAEEVGTSGQSVYYAMNGRGLPSSNTSRRIAEAFGLSSDDFFLETPEFVIRAAMAYADAPIRSRVMEEKALTDHERKKKDWERRRLHLERKGDFYSVGVGDQQFGMAASSKEVAAHKDYKMGLRDAKADPTIPIGT